MLLSIQYFCSCPHCTVKTSTTIATVKFFTGELVESLIINGNHKDAEEAIFRGASTEYYGRGWLLYFAKQRNIRELANYLDKNAYLGTKDNWTDLLNWGTSNDFQELVQYVIDNNNDLSYRNIGDYDFVILETAVSEGRTHIVNMLLDNGYPINFNILPRLYAIAQKNGHKLVINVLNEYFNKSTAQRLSKRLIERQTQQIN